jgi:hypothetical protein
VIVVGSLLMRSTPGLVIFEVIIPDYRPHDDVKAELLTDGRYDAQVLTPRYLAVLLSTGRHDAIIQPHRVTAIIDT